MRFLSPRGPWTAVAVASLLAAASASAGLAGSVTPALQDGEATCSDVTRCPQSLTVSKSATTSFTRTWQWTIDKSVAPHAWTLFANESGTSAYVVTVQRTGSIDSGWAVSGAITIENETPLAATLTSVRDVISGGIAAPVDCGVTFPYVLAAGATLSCAYTAPLPNGSQRLNSATVTTTGPVAGGTANAAVIFGNPTTVSNAEIDVVDTNGGSWHFTGSGSVSYDRTFLCDGDEGSHGNTATIVQTGQSDSAMVTVACNEIAVSKSADTPTSLRTWKWSIVKSGDQTYLFLDPGQPFVVHYLVTVRATSEDSDWHATGEIVISNPTPRSVHLAAVTDTMPGSSPITPDCGGAVPGFLAPGGLVVCTWEADLASGANVLNTAYVTRTNFAWSPTGQATPIGKTIMDASALVDFSNAIRTEIDECVDVADVFDDEPPVDLGTVCAEQSPYSHTFPFEMTFRYLKVEECRFTVHNVASLETNDTGVARWASHTVDVDLRCVCGCTLSPHYWATHTKRGPMPYDEDWKLIGNLEESTGFYLADKSWYDTLWTEGAQHPYYILAHAWIAAWLNSLDGSWTPMEIRQALAESESLFAIYSPEDVVTGGKEVSLRMLQLAGLLGMYNDGTLGPGHCTEEQTTGR